MNIGRKLCIKVVFLCSTMCKIVATRDDSVVKFIVNSKLRINRRGIVTTILPFVTAEMPIFF